MFSSALNALKSLSNLITNTDAFIEEDSTIKDLQALITSTKTSQQKNGIKNMICMAQRGKTNTSHSDLIFKIIDVKDIETKQLINLFFILHVYNPLTGEKDITRTEYVFENYKQILLEDFNDERTQVVANTIRFLIEMNDLTSFCYFNAPLRKILRAGDFLLKCLALTLVAKLCQTQIHFVVNHDLTEEVVSLLDDNSLQVRTCALNCINNSISSNVAPEKIFQIFEALQTATEITTVRAAVSVSQFIEHSFTIFTENEQSKIVEKLKETMSWSFYIAYYAAKALLAMCPATCDTVFENLCVFLHVRNEESDFLFDFLAEIVENYNIFVDNRLFSIFSDDRRVVKESKLRILRRNPDNIAIREIRSLCGTELTIGALEFFIQNEIFDEKMFLVAQENNYNELKSLICAYRPVSTCWRTGISNHFRVMDNSDECLLVASLYFFNVPNIEGADASAMLRFYCNFYLRGVIDKEELDKRVMEVGGPVIFCEYNVLFNQTKVKDEFFECVEKKKIIDETVEKKLITCKINNKEEINSKNKALQNNSQNKKAQNSELQQKEIQKNGKNKEPVIADKINFSRENVVVQNNNIFLKSAIRNYCEFYAYNRKTPIKKIAEEPVKNEIDLMRPFSQKSDDIIDAIRTKYGQSTDKTANSIGLKSISNICFNAVLLLNDNDVVLSVKNITRPFTAATSLPNSEPINIISTGEYKIGVMNVPTSFTLKVNGLYGYQIAVTLQMCLLKAEMEDSKQFERFNEIKRSVVVDSLIFDKFETDFFCAILMKSELFFKKVEEKWIVKGENDILLDYIEKNNKGAVF